MSESLLISGEGRLRRLTLNRPEKRNALDAALCCRLVEAIGEAADDPQVGAILLDARGPVFCAGMDLHEVLEIDPGELTTLQQELFTIGTRLRKPMLAAVQGPALGGGLGLALIAHVVVAASDATFGLTEARVGLWPYVIFPVVAAATGNRKATEMALTARIFGAEEALRVGIADVVVAREQLPEEARRMAAQLAEGSASAARDGLEFLHEACGPAAAAGYRRRTHVSPDFREGVAAFHEKRIPVWPSHKS
jgi:methylglutaconyl-CoA hydratase